MIGQGSPSPFLRFDSAKTFKGFWKVAFAVLLCFCAQLGVANSIVSIFRSGKFCSSTSLFAQTNQSSSQRPPPTEKFASTLIESAPSRSTLFGNGMAGNRLAPRISDNGSAGNSRNDGDEIELRFSWGGGESRQWVGSVSVSQGQLSNAKTLGLTSDASGSVLLSDGQVKVNQWTSTNYGGADIKLKVEEDAALTVILYPANVPELKIERTISVSELISGTFNEELDATGNRFSIARTPGDFLRVDLNRDHLVFSPRETFEIGVRANRTQISAKAANCRFRLTSVHSKVPVSKWTKTVTMELDRTGSGNAGLVRIPIPSSEGVYNLEIEVEPSWYQASFRGKSSVRRTVQFVVINENAPRQNENDAWRLVSTIDPTKSLESELAPNLTIPPFARYGQTAHKSIGNQLRRAVVVDQKPMLELASGGWQAIPIDVEQIDRPHVVEIEFLADQPTAMGVSLLQTDESGQVPLFGFDSGVVVPKTVVDSVATEDGRIRETHRVVFWPRIKNPYLLLANRHSSRPAVVGKIQVLSGPSRLPSNKDFTNDANGSAQGSLHSTNLQQRKFMAFYESPLFPENFGASEKIDPNVGQPLDDWKMFYQGADRFVQYLKANSYRGAFVSVACDGSSIYPSQILDSSPKHDSGIFFSNGQDPVRKDVLEMLFRMFEREGLVLVPTLALSGPIAKIEEARLRSNGNDQYEMVDQNQNRLSREQRADLPIYNPLNRQLQKLVTDVVGEVSDRYGRYESFSGLALVCRPDTITLLPGRQWGYDSATIQQFFQTVSVRAPVQWLEVQQLLASSLEEPWLRWRANQMSLWYQSMLASLRMHVPEGKLYLAPVDLYRNEELKASLSPTLHSNADFESQMLNIGLDAQAIAQTPGLELLKPHRVSPNDSLAANRVEINVADSRQTDEFYRSSGSSAELFTHRISWAHFEQLQQQNPFGNQQSTIMRLQQLTPAAQWNRQRFLNSLRVNDSRMMIDGGWMISMGEEGDLKEYVDVFNRLPDVDFVDVRLAKSLERFDHATMPVVVRQVQSNGQSYFYAVNASPWPVKVKLALRTATAAAAEDLAGLESFSDQAFTVTEESDQPLIEFEMQPLSICGAKSSSPFEVADYEFELPGNAADRLRKQVNLLQAKLAESSQVAGLPVLKNSSFELFDQPSLNNWDYGQQSTAKLQLDTENAFQGRVSLALRNTETTPVWIRSNVFEPPKTGRLSVSVWLKTDDPTEQPPLRLAIEGKVGESSYYRFGSVGSLSPNPQSNQINDQWQRFAVHFDDLPVERLTSLRIGFDLMGKGNVQLDQVEVFDRWFDKNDTKVITQRLASCGPLLANQATFESCRLLLNGYWLQFLDEHFGESVEQVNPELTTPATESGPIIQANPEVEERGKSMFRRFRKFGQPRKPSMR